MIVLENIKIFYLETMRDLCSVYLVRRTIIFHSLILQVTVKQCQANLILRFYRRDGVFLVRTPRRSRKESFAVPVARRFQALVRHFGRKKAI